MSDVGTVGTVGPVTTISDVALNIEELTNQKAKQFMEDKMEIKAQSLSKWIGNNTIEGEIPSIFLKIRDSNPQEIAAALNKVATEKEEFLIPIYKTALQMTLFQPFRDVCYKTFHVFNTKLASNPVQLNALNQAVQQILQQNINKMRDISGFLNSLEKSDPTFKSPLKAKSSEPPVTGGPAARLEFGEVPAAPAPAPSPPKPPAPPPTPAPSPPNPAAPVPDAETQEVPTDAELIGPEGKVRQIRNATSGRIFKVKTFTFWDELNGSNDVSKAVQAFISKNDSSLIEKLKFKGDNMESLTYLNTPFHAKEVLQRALKNELIDSNGKPQKTNSAQISLLTTQFNRTRVAKENETKASGKPQSGTKRARSVSFVKGYESKKQKREGRMEAC
jgi:hypothetical protein